MRIVQLAGQRRDVRARRAGRWLRARGHDVLHVEGFDQRPSADGSVLERVDDLDGCPSYVVRGPSAHLAQEVILRELAPDAVHAHGLDAFWRYASGPAWSEDIARAAFFGTPLADLGLRLERGRVPVVYDAHEYERDRPWRWSRPRQAEEWALKERLALPSAEAVVTVSPHIAQALAQDHGLEEEPAVVWNAPFRPRPLRTAEARAALEVEPNDRLVVFSGYPTPDRALDELVSAVRAVQGFDRAHRWRLLLFGARRDATVGELVDHAGGEIRGMVPYPWPEEPGLTLLDYLSACHVAFSGAWTDFRSWKWSGPNKLFEYAFAGVPQVSAEISTFEDMLASWDLGRTFATPAELVGSLIAFAERRVERRDDFVETFAMDVAGDAYGEIFDRLAAA